MCKDTKYKEFAYLIMEADKSQYLQFAAWGPEGAYSIVSV